MIDINKLRQSAQAATPGPWVAAGPSFGESLPKYLNEVAVDREGDEDDGYSICNAPIGLNEECSDDMAFIAEANPLTIEELLDRLEAAEKSRDDLLACLGEWLDKTKWVQQGVNEGTISAKYLGLHRADVMSSLLGEAEKERDALRAKVAEMEKQEPIFWWRPRSDGAYEGPIHNSIIEQVRKQSGAWSPLYALPGAQAQPAPSIPEISDDLIEAIESRAEQSYRRHHGGVRGQQLTPADALSWHIIHATRDVLAAAPEAKPCP